MRVSALWQDISCSRIACHNTLVFHMDSTSTFCPVRNTLLVGLDQILTQGIQMRSSPASSSSTQWSNPPVAIQHLDVRMYPQSRDERGIYGLTFPQVRPIPGGAVGHSTNPTMQAHAAPWHLILLLACRCTTYFWKPKCTRTGIAVWAGWPERSHLLLDYGRCRD